MKVFISSSLPRSAALATFMAKWLRDLIQVLEPWVSTEGLTKGQPWFSEIGTELKGMAAAIVCVTPENLHEDWLLFEAGAAAGPGHPCFTYLLDIAPTDITGPLANIQHTTADKEDTLRMVRDINKQLGERRVPDDVLAKQFEHLWPDLEEKLAEIREMDGAPAEAPTRDTNDMLVEVLDILRQRSRDQALPEGFAKFLSAEASGSGIASAYTSIDEIAGRSSASIVSEAAKEAIRQAQWFESSGVAEGPTAKSDEDESDER